MFHCAFGDFYEYFIPRHLATERGFLLRRRARAEHFLHRLLADAKLNFQSTGTWNHGCGPLAWRDSGRLLRVRQVRAFIGDAHGLQTLDLLAGSSHALLGTFPLTKHFVTRSCFRSKTSFFVVELLPLQGFLRRLWRLIHAACDECGSRRRVCGFDTLRARLKPSLSRVLGDVVLHLGGSTVWEDVGRNSLQFQLLSGHQNALRQSLHRVNGWLDGTTVLKGVTKRLELGAFVFFVRRILGSLFFELLFQLICQRIAFTFTVARRIVFIRLATARRIFVTRVSLRILLHLSFEEQIRMFANLFELVRFAHSQATGETRHARVRVRAIRGRSTRQFTNQTDSLPSFKPENHFLLYPKVFKDALRLRHRKLTEIGIRPRHGSGLAARSTIFRRIWYSHTSNIVVELSSESLDSPRRLEM
mmetsp:Transcript_2509/g.9753  ORF Transcript_2509/g.9753 Transcript_2509/m.9753 type:complete len:417 (+) Transcript_2509:511-1761(+)